MPKLMQIDILSDDKGKVSVATEVLAKGISKDLLITILNEIIAEIKNGKIS